MNQEQGNKIGNPELAWPWDQLTEYTALHVYGAASLTRTVI